MGSNITSRPEIIHCFDCYQDKERKHYHVGFTSCNYCIEKADIIAMREELNAPIVAKLHIFNFMLTVEGMKRYGEKQEN